LFSGCVSYPNFKSCAVAGALSAGSFCHENISGVQTDLPFEETLDLIEGHSIIIPLEEFEKIKTFMDQACRELGPRCALEARSALKSVTP
jgi:hypothetical protein